MKYPYCRRLFLILIFIFSISEAGAEVTDLLNYEDSDALTRESSGVYKISPAKNLFDAPVGSRFNLFIPGIPAYEVIHDRKETLSGGGLSWFGYLGSLGPGFRVALIRQNNRVQGRIMTPEGVFIIQTRDNQNIYLTDLDLAGIKHAGTDVSDIKISEPPPRATNHYAMAESQVFKSVETAFSTIDLMVLYNQSFSSKYPGDALMTRLNELISIANQAYIDSKVMITLRLVHSEQVIYSDSIDNETALDALTDGTGSFSGVTALRAKHRADLVMLLRPYDRYYHNSCGMAWLNGYNGYDISLYADKGFCVVSEGTDGNYYCDDYTFTHELGHTMGNAHDREHANAQGAYYYSYGHYITGNYAFGTIMSYNGPTLGYFSNPDITRCNELPCGINITESFPANNALSMNNTRAKVAAFMDDTFTVNPSSDVNIMGLYVSGTSEPETNTPFTVTAVAGNPENQTIYYKFYYRAHYGTPGYDTAPWMVVQDYSSSNSARFNFSVAGAYIIVVRAVLDINNEPAALPITGQVVTVGNTSQVFIQNLSGSLPANLNSGDTVTYSVSAAGPSQAPLYYKFYYRANYGNSDYNYTAWTVMQDYSSDNTCQYSFPAAGDYIVVARVVTDPENEPEILPITGTYVHVK